MHYRLIDEMEGVRTFVVTLDTGEEVMSTLVKLAEDLQFGSSSVTGIGAFSHTKLGYFNPATSDFRENVVDEQCELLSFIGNIAEGEDGNPKLHAHVVLGRHDATTRGGHLVEAVVRPTLELVIVEHPMHLQRKHDPATGLVLLQP